MLDFENDTIDVNNLPKMESIIFTKLHVDFWKIILVNFCILSTIIFVAISTMVFIKYEILAPYIYHIIFFILIILFLIFISNRIGFLKKKYAFRTHDVVFVSGIIATHTMVIPYNRVQHIALHEGFLSRYFGLASIEIFTAGGDNSDITIPGIEKQQAENIKQLLMNKIKTID